MTYARDLPDGLGDIREGWWGYRPVVREGSRVVFEAAGLFRKGWGNLTRRFREYAIREGHRDAKGIPPIVGGGRPIDASSDHPDCILIG